MDGLIAAKKSFEANDMKARFWKVNGNTNLLKIIYYPGSLDNLDKEHLDNKLSWLYIKFMSRIKCIGLLVKRKEITQTHYKFKPSPITNK